MLFVNNYPYFFLILDFVDLSSTSLFTELFDELYQTLPTTNHVAEPLNVCEPLLDLIIMFFCFNRLSYCTIFRLGQEFFAQQVNSIYNLIASSLLNFDKVGSLV